MPGPQTTLLWNKNTQLPEAVALDEVTPRLQSGDYVVYDGTKTEQTVGDSGVTVQVDPGQAQFREQSLDERQALLEAAKRSQEAAELEQEAQFEGAADAVRAFGDAYVDAMTLGIVDPTEGDTAYNIQRRNLAEARPGARTAGTLTALAVTLLPTGGAGTVAQGARGVGALAKMGSAASKATPLGAAIKIQEAVTTGLRNARVARGGAKGILPVAAEEAVGGAIGGAIIASGHEVANVVHGKPVSGEAIVDEITMGALLGGGLGVAGGAFGRAAAKIKTSRADVTAAAELDKLLPVANEAFGETVATWQAARREAARRMSKLDELEAQGLLDTAELKGKQWLKARRQFAKNVDQAESRLLKTAGVDSLDAAMKRLGEVIESGKTHEVQALAAAFGQYGKAIQKLDDSLRIVDDDVEQLFRLATIDDLDGVMPADEHVFNVLGRKLDEGVSDDELARFAGAQGFLDDVESGLGRRIDDMPRGQKTATSDRVTADQRVRKFEPSSEWQEVPEGTVVPPGGEIRMDLSGKTEARWPGLAKTKGRSEPAPSRVEPSPRLRDFDTGDLDSPGVPHLDLDRMDQPLGGPQSAEFDLSDIADVTQGDDLLFQLAASKRAGRPAGREQLKSAFFDRPTVEVPNRVRSESPIGELPQYQQPAGSTQPTQKLKTDVKQDEQFGPVFDPVRHEKDRRAAEKLAREAEKLEAKAQKAREAAEKAAQKADDKAAREAAKKADQAEEQAKVARQASNEAQAKLKASLEARGALTRESLVGNPESALGARIDDILRQFQDATGHRLGSEEARLLAKELGVNLTKIDNAGPLAQKILDVWALKQLANALADETSGLGKALRSKRPGALGQAVRSGLVTKTRAGMRQVAGPFAGGFFGSLMGSAVSTVLGSVGMVAGLAGKMRNAAVIGIAKALNPVARRGLTAYAVMPQKVSYNGGPPTAKFEEKAEQLRQFVASKDAVSEQLDHEFAELAMIDPGAALAAKEVTIKRLENLEARLPAGTYRGPLLPPGPPTQDQLDDFNLYEAATWNRDLVFGLIRAGSMPDAVVSAMREQHPDFLFEITDWVAQNQDAVAKAPYQSQLALSKLLGVPIVPEADPLYAQRQQETWLKVKEEADQAQMAQQGASIMRGGMPAPTPMTPAQQFATLPAIR